MNSSLLQRVMISACIDFRRINLLIIWNEAFFEKKSLICVAEFFCFRHIKEQFKWTEWNDLQITFAGWTELWEECNQECVFGLLEIGTSSVLKSQVWFSIRILKTGIWNIHLTLYHSGVAQLFCHTPSKTQTFREVVGKSKYGVRLSRKDLFSRSRKSNFQLLLAEFYEALITHSACLNVFWF